MTQYIAILRGINVAGKRRILMDDLRKLFRDIGFTDVQTYIQSGNVIFNSKEEENNLELAQCIEKSISERFGFEIPVITRTASEWDEMASSNPFIENGGTDIERLHVTLLKDTPNTDLQAKTNLQNCSPDKFEVKNRNVFIYCAGKYSASKLTNAFFEKNLKVPATTRNWKTVLEILKLYGAQ